MRGAVAGARLRGVVGVRDAIAALRVPSRDMDPLQPPELHVEGSGSPAWRACRGAGYRREEPIVRLSSGDVSL